MDANELILLGVGSCGASGPVTIVLDHFTDADGVLLTSHTPDASPASWQNFDGTYQISSNQATAASLTHGQAIVGINTGQADCTISASQQHANSQGVLARLTDRLNYWWMNRAASSFVLYEVNNNTFTQRASASHPKVTPETYTLTCSGSTITASAGSDSCPYASASFNQSATTHGLYSDGTTNRIYDDFQVTVP